MSDYVMPTLIVLHHNHVLYLYTRNDRVAEALKLDSYSIKCQVQNLFVLGNKFLADFCEDRQLPKEYVSTISQHMAPKEYSSVHNNIESRPASKHIV